MSKVIRAQYRAVIQEHVAEAELEQVFEECRKRTEEEKTRGNILTAAMCRYQKMVFLYVEYITEEGQDWAVETIPDRWFDFAGRVLQKWPSADAKDRYWAYMYPVFWFDTPKSLEQWEREVEPDERCGRIAVLYPDKLFSYVCHHQAIVEEGLLVGDRYQTISLHENILFSYFENPRDREQVNIRRSPEPSEEIEKWEAVDPESHFYHFPEANGENFLIIETVFSVPQLKCQQ